MKSGAARIALIYLTIAFLWILLSDKALYAFHKALSPETFNIINSGNGFLFVAITAYFLYRLIYADEQKLIGATKRSIESNNEVKRLDDIITRINNIVVITDQNNYVTWCNKAFENFTGYKLEEIAGYTLGTFFVDGDTNIDVLNYILDSKKTFKSFSVEVGCRKKNGEKFWVYGEYSPLFDDNREFTGYISVYSDITNLKTTVHETTRQNERLREIAWLSSHEVRRPLANMVGLITLLKNTPYMTEKVKILDSISKAAEELDKIVYVLNLTIGDELEQTTQTAKQN